MQNNAVYLLLLVSLFLNLNAYAEDALPKPIDHSQEQAKTEDASLKATAKKPRLFWYRDSSEWITSVLVREDMMNQPASRIVTNGKRFDVAIGDRFSLYSWGKKNRTTGWVIGADGGVVTTLTRFDKGDTSQNDIVFTTETFDGHFGGFLAYGKRNYAWMFRTAHISAHLVDNSPRINNFISYSRFWSEIAAVWSITPPRKIKTWGGRVFGSLGLNWKATPGEKNPRAQFGFTMFHHLSGYDSWAVIGSTDFVNEGIQGQDPHWNFFLGLGYPKRAYSKRRPFKVGLMAMAGSESRNQFFNEDTSFTGFALQMEL